MRKIYGPHKVKSQRRQTRWSPSEKKTGKSNRKRLVFWIYWSFILYDDGDTCSDWIDSFSVPLTMWWLPWIPLVAGDETFCEFSSHHSRHHSFCGCRRGRGELWNMNKRMKYLQGCGDFTLGGKRKGCKGGARQDKGGGMRWTHSINTTTNWTFWIGLYIKEKPTR